MHGPIGHNDYRAYKPWLRDEFEFRCVYCLTRELWMNQGYNGFTIDHVKPKSSHADLVADYDNLVYACFRCNTLKSTILGLPDPCSSTLAKHLKLRSGMFIALTSRGRRMIEYLRLNQTERVSERRRYLVMFEMQDRLPKELLLLTFGYPADLPDLSALKPPRGNSRPRGLRLAKLARKNAGKLAPYY